VALLGAAAASPLALAVLMAVTAALAADEVVRVRWGSAIPLRADGSGRPMRIGRTADVLLLDPRRLPTALAAAALPLAAAAGVDTLTAALPAVVIVLFVHRLFTPTEKRALHEVALSTTAVVALGLAAAGPVLLEEVGRSVAVVVLLLVAVYDVGDYLVGTEASTVWEGPVSGMAAVVVFAFGASVIPLEPLDQATTLAIGAVVALLAPLGPPAASLLVGDGRTRARFVRRIDSLLVLGPLSAWAVAAIV
jgi:CDP-diglyceride synthetase